MKKFAFLFLTVFVVSARSQTFISKTPTFIGKNLQEVLTINTANGNNITQNKTEEVSGSGMETTLIFKDGKTPINYTYHFDKNNICLSLIITTLDKPTKDLILSDIEKKCPEKLSKKSRLQKLDGHNYIWNIQGDETMYVFSNTESK